MYSHTTPAKNPQATPYVLGCHPTLSSTGDSPTTDSSGETCCPSLLYSSISSLTADTSELSICPQDFSEEVLGTKELEDDGWVVVNKSEHLHYTPPYVAYDIHEPALASDIDTVLIAGGEDTTASALPDFDLGTYRELTYEQPHPLHIPTDTETYQTRAKVAAREVQIEALSAKISDLRAGFDAESQEKVAELRPIMDYLHDQILVIQKQMADAWNAFSTERQQAQAVVTAKVTDLEVQIHILKEENSKAASFLAPIRRLPIEMLAEIFTLCIFCHTHSPLELMRVCRSWRAVVLTMPRIWSDVRLCTWTKTEKVEFILERTGVTPLDVEIDTGMDMFKMVDANEFRRYAGLELAATEAKRWRNLTVNNFPSKLDIDAHSTPEKPVIVFNGPMDGLESFKIKDICEESVVFNQLLDVVGSSSHDKLTDMELSSPNAIYHLGQPQFASVFRNLVTFKVNVREMRTEVDILAQFQQLEILEAYRLRLPTYALQTDLPIVRTLKRMKIKTVSVQWMAGRIFPNMEDCTIIWPHYPETLAPGGGVDLPVCTHFMYDDHIIDTLPNFRIPKLDTLIVRNEAWNKPRGSTQLAAVWNGNAGQAPPLKPRVLHLETQCHDQHLINALSMLSDLQELHLGVVRPDGLGKKFFTALQAKKGKSSRSAPAATHVATLCPVLRAFGIRYRRWMRDDEGDEITPLLHKIIESRQKTDAPLHSFKFWPTKETPDEGAAELCGPVLEAGGEWDTGDYVGGKEEGGGLTAPPTAPIPQPA